jgi:putative endonuclease
LFREKCLHMFFTYILYSDELDRYYIGSCENVEERLRSHLSNHKGFTGKAKDWKVVHSEEHPTRTEAYARERQIKKWKSRKMLERLVRGWNKQIISTPPTFSLPCLSCQIIRQRKILSFHENRN